MQTGASNLGSMQARLNRLDWDAIERELEEFGCAKTPPLLLPEECQELINLYPDDTQFRKSVHMAPKRFGMGDYKYFNAPLPVLVQSLRTHAYPFLAAIANRWMQKLEAPERYPSDLSSFLSVCREHDQGHPTPLLLHYEAGGYNRLHQDVYGSIVFPLQLVCMLSRVGDDYTGGSFLLVEQRPFAHLRGDAIVAEQGEIIIFPSRFRPGAGKRRFYRLRMRHGASRVTSGRRYTLGVIFHDAQ